MPESFLHRDLRGRPREASAYQLVAALTPEQSMNWSALKMTDQLRLVSRGSDLIPIDNPVIRRAASKLGLAPDAWFDAAGVPPALPAD